MPVNAKSTEARAQLAYFGGRRAVQLRPDPWPLANEELRKWLDNSLVNGKLAYGTDSLTRKFEDAWAEYHHVRFAIALNSGTSALTAAYFGCGLGRLPFGSAEQADEEVIVGAFGFFATAAALLPIGIRPVFCDVDEDNGCLDPVLASAAVTERTRGIGVTHIAGHPAAMPAFSQLGRERGLAIVEDGSHAHGALQNGRLVGTLGDAAAFSFQAAKLVCGGEGGMLVTDDESVFQRACLLANPRRLQGTSVEVKSKLADTGFGLKLRMGPLEASLAHFHLTHMDELISSRTMRLERLSKGVTERGVRHFIPPLTQQGNTRGAQYQYMLRLALPPEFSVGRARAVVVRLLEAEGVRVRHSNTRAIYALPLFARGRTRGVFPRTDRLQASVIFLPTFTTEPVEIVDQYVDAISKVDKVLLDILAPAVLDPQTLGDRLGQLG